MYYRRIPNAVLVRNPDLYHNYLNHDVKSTYSEDVNTHNQSPEVLDEKVEIPMPNREEKYIENEERAENTEKESIELSKQRSNIGFKSFEIIIVLIIVILIIAFNGG